MSMTREEAIALLNEQYETCKRIYDCSADQRKSYPNVPQFMEALVCKCSKCGYPISYFWSRTQFCPNCGAPMTDEAVEMMMERLEALKDGSTAD